LIIVCVAAPLVATAQFQVPLQTPVHVLRASTVLVDRLVQLLIFLPEPTLKVAFVVLVTTVQQTRVLQFLAVSAVIQAQSAVVFVYNVLLDFTVLSRHLQTQLLVPQVTIVLLEQGTSRPTNVLLEPLEMLLWSLIFSISLLLLIN
jgi:hypothetical protein